MTEDPENTSGAAGEPGVAAAPTPAFEAVAAPAVETAAAAVPGAAAASGDEAVLALRGSEPRWLLGPALWVGGVLMWAYVVMGIFTTTRLGPKGMPLGEGAAVFWVMAAAGLAGYFAVQRSLMATSGGDVLPRTGIVALGALVTWMALLLVAIIVGQVGGDGPVTLVLSLASAGIVWRGRILTNRGLAIAGDSRLVRTMCWIAAALVTAFALLLR